MLIETLVEKIKPKEMEKNEKDMSKTLELFAVFALSRFSRTE